MPFTYQCWGRYPKTRQTAKKIYWTSDPIPLPDGAGPVLPFGLGRSYGDVCLNDGGLLLDTYPLRRFIAFDPATGILRCESGVTMAQILELSVPQGWFLPVTPGTKFVTVGGAIANDVHGKNHHWEGTFGHHVRAFELVGSGGERRLCSPRDNPERFTATIGGLGLTGLITWAEIQLKPARSRLIDAEYIRCGTLGELLTLCAESESAFNYTVAWIDSTAPRDELGRGIFIRGNHSEAPALGHTPAKAATRVPFDAPDFVLNPMSMRAFNWLYYHKQLRRRCAHRVDYEPFFYPLDKLLAWNRLYGKRGLTQYQFVVPPSEAVAVVTAVLRETATWEVGSFLSVLKVFGPRPSVGLMSFPRHGVTLAMDFPVSGQLFRVLDRLDQIVREAGGAVYPAKDARMSADNFQAFYPQWDQFAQYIDPQFSSSFWRRVTNAKNPDRRCHVSNRAGDREPVRS